MAGSEEETYSTIFTSLKHPARRKILRLLSEEPRNFSEILEALGISSSHLTYHLESLGELVSKTEDGRYRLSTFGEAAVTTMSKVEEIPKVTELKHPHPLSLKWKPLFAALMIGLVVLAGVSYTQYQSLNRLSAEYEELSSEYEKLKDLVELVGKGALLQSEYTLRYEYEKVDSGIFKIGGYPWYCVIYNPYDNSTLYLLLSINTIRTESYFNISVQEGNVFDVETDETVPVIWSANATVSNIYRVPIAKGWYIISLVGPIRKHLDASGNVVHTFGPMPLASEVDCWMLLRIIYEGKYSPFIVKSY